MSEPTYTITLTETERTLLARALGLFVAKLTNAPVFVEAPSGGTQAARAVLSPPAQTPPTPPAAAAPVPPVPEPRDRWARDRKGSEVSMPEGYAAREVNICKTEQKQPRKQGGKPYLKVTWQSEGRGFVDANCFDSQLWPWLIGQSGRRTTIYIVKVGRISERRGGASVTHLFGKVGLVLFVIAVVISFSYALSVFGEIIAHDAPNDLPEWDEDWVYPNDADEEETIG